MARFHHSCSARFPSPSPHFSSGDLGSLPYWNCEECRLPSLYFIFTSSAVSRSTSAKADVLPPVCLPIPITLDSSRTNTPSLQPYNLTPPGGNVALFFALNKSYFILNEFSHLKASLLLPTWTLSSPSSPGVTGTRDLPCGISIFYKQ